MTVNSFFLLLLVGLTGIYVFFSPMNIQVKYEEDIAMLDLNNFTMYKIDTGGLLSTMTGSSGKRFINRHNYTQHYKVYDINFTDASHQFFQNMVSDFALYKDEKVFLEGNVRYNRADGLKFSSDEAQYNHRNAVVTTDGPFMVTEAGNWLKGTKLYYDSIREVAEGEYIKGVYTVMDRKGK